jgi:hypothetical protein
LLLQWRPCGCTVRAIRHICRALHLLRHHEVSSPAKRIKSKVESDNPLAFEVAAPEHLISCRVPLSLTVSPACSQPLEVCSPDLAFEQSLRGAVRPMVQSWRYCKWQGYDRRFQSNTLCSAGMVKHSLDSDASRLGRALLRAYPLCNAGWR